MGPDQPSLEGGYGCLKVLLILQLLAKSQSVLLGQCLGEELCKGENRRAEVSLLRASLYSTPCLSMLCFSCQTSPQAPSSERLQPTSLHHIWLCPSQSVGCLPYLFSVYNCLVSRVRATSRDGMVGTFTAPPRLVATALLTQHSMSSSDPAV